MARGRDRHAAHQAAVAMLGRSLSRRAKNRCELCENSASLKVVEVDPTYDEPDEERAILICANCEAAMQGKKTDPTTLRFLEGVVWSECTPVQLTAVRMLKELSASGVRWATDCLDNLFLDPEIEGMI